MRKREIHTETDPIEVAIEHHVGHYYNIKWRFKPKTIERNFLGIRFKVTVKDRKWGYVKYYRSPCRDSDNPRENRWLYWGNYSFNSFDERQVAEEKGKLAQCHTFADLDRIYRQTEYRERYQRDCLEYDRKLAAANARINEL